MASPQPSRYLSQREKHRSDEMQAPDIPSTTPPEDANDAISRSRSRYRRKPGAADRASDQRLPSQQHQSELPSRYHSKRQSPMNTLYQEQVVRSPPRMHREPSSGGKQHDSREVTPPAAPGAVDERTRGKEPSQPHQSRSVSPPEIEPAGHLSIPPEPVEQPVRGDGPPQSGQIRATKSMSELPVMNDEDAGCFSGFFKRKQAAPGDAEADSKAPVQRPKTAKDGPQTIRPGGGGIVPGIDAPISAVNSGDRQVMVECGISKRSFAVTPETTSVDILKSASICMAERIDVKSALVLEYFGSVGVQRPIRRYEHIREIMNSWDSDRQNSLIIVDPGTGTVEPELTLSGVPMVRPAEQAWWLSYSQKINKWEKRYVVLREDGQLVHMKNPDKPRDTENICHMSDFDIYTPTPDKQKKKIKPPKKFCYAIKSQRKTAMFESTNDFVHFFSTGDRTVGEDFYNTIQSYRSWYLVHVLEAGRKEKPKPSASESRHHSPGHGQSKKTHCPHDSMDSNYQLGSFKPLMDMDHFQRRPGSSGSQQESEFHRSSGPSETRSPQRHVSSRRQHPPPALNNRPILADDEPLANLGRSTSVKRTSLGHSASVKRASLGRSASVKRASSADRKEFSDSGFTAGPNLLNGGLASGDGLQRQQSTRRHVSNTEMTRSSSTRDGSRGHQRNSSSDLDRSQSRRIKPKPLVDLTPEYKEPPQHIPKGRGYKPEAVGPGGLIKSATTPEDPLGLPSTTVFRKDREPRQMPGPNPHSPGLIDLTPQHREPVHHTRKGRGLSPENSHPGGLVHHASSQEDPLGLPQNNVFRNVPPEGRHREVSGSQHNQVPRRQTSVRQQPDAFTGEGLLGAAENRQGWGTQTKGRGVIDGSHAGGKPLIDLDDDRTFTQGSLLNKVQKAEGIPKPIIDRDRKYG